MATREIVSTICDVCSTGGAETYTIGHGRTTRIVDLCAKHAAPVVKVMDAGRSSRTPARRSA